MSASCGRRGNRALLAIDSPNTVSVDRAEIWLARVNRAAKKDRPQEDGAEVDDYRRILRLGIPLGTQPEAARFRAALVRLLDYSQVGDGPPIEFYNDLTTDTGRAQLQSAVLAIVLELLHNARRHSKSKSILLV